MASHWCCACRPRAGDVGLHRSGLEPDHRARLQSWLDLPNGMMLVTGPTGSGKSTTLYGALSEINDGVRKLITVEDPVGCDCRALFRSRRRPTSATPLRVRCAPSCGMTRT